MSLNLTLLAFLGVLGLLLILSLVRNPFFGLYAYLFVFYNHPDFRWWGEGLPEIRWSLMAAVVTVVSLAVHPPPRSTVPWYTTFVARILILFTVWSWIQVGWAVSMEAHLEHCILFTKYCLLFYLIYRLSFDVKAIEDFAWAHVAGCFIFGWIMYTSSSAGRMEVLLGSAMSDANEIGMHLATGLIFGGVLFLKNVGIRRWLALAPLPFILNGIILGGSRGATLALVVSGIVMLYLIPSQYFRSVFGAGILGCVLLSILSHDLFWDRMGTLWDEQSGFTLTKEASAASRIDIINSQFKMIEDYPFGAGFRGTFALSKFYMDGELLDSTVGGRSSHNTVMAILVGQGIPGGIFLLLLLAWIAKELVRLKTLDQYGLPIVLGFYRAAVGGSLTAFFVSSLTINNLKAEVGIWLIALLAALSTLSYESLKGFSTPTIAEKSKAGSL